MPCPLCEKTHSYRLTVERSVAFGLMTADAPATRTRSFVRLFTCPVKGTQFQATLTLHETDMDPILNVTIGEAT
jgi:hypothetical protein